MKFAIATAMLTSVPAFAGTIFNIGDLVVSVEGNGVMGASSGPYGDNQAAPLSLFQFSVNGTTSATYVNSLVLPQSNSGANFAVSGEYGSSSEATLQLSGNGEYLTIGGYGVNAAAFNADPGTYSLSSANTALASRQPARVTTAAVRVARAIPLTNAARAAPASRSPWPTVSPSTHIFPGTRCRSARSAP